MAKFYFNTVQPFEVNLVSRTTLSEPRLAYRPPALLRRSQAAGRLLACRVNQSLAGWAEIYPIRGRDWGISTIYVRPQWRRHGLGGRLIKLADKKLHSRRVFIATSHPTIVKVLLGLRYSPIDFWHVPKLTLVSLIVSRYYHPVSWLKLFTSAGSGLKFYVRP